MNRRAKRVHVFGRHKLETGCGQPSARRECVPQHRAAAVTCEDCLRVLAEPRTVTSDVTTRGELHRKAEMQSVEITFYSDINEWHIEWPEGVVTIAETPGGAFRAVKRRDAKRAKGSSAFIMTRITWHNVPADFVPPKDEGSP